MLLSLDIETKCGVGCAEKCDHALDAYRNAITVVGVYDGERGYTFRKLEDLGRFLAYVKEPQLLFHNGKFDLHTLAVKGMDLTHLWAHDSLLAAFVLTEKIPDAWLASYESKRKHLNSALPRGYSHRPGSLHSLKTLAPYFLNVEPFWEDPTNHDSDEYVLKDVTYTYQLFRELERRLKAENSFEFYEKRMLPWTKMLLSAERRGISLDLAALEVRDLAAQAVAQEARRNLDELWAPAYQRYFTMQNVELIRKYEQMKNAAVIKMKQPNAEKVEALERRYHSLYSKAALQLPKAMNLDSPAQLSWLLKEHLGLDITDFDGEETTGKPVLQKLAGQGRSDIKEFLRYRKARKLTSAFFPSYRAMQVGGVLHCSFNPTGTRTGRLSSSQPNLQQVEKGLHPLFVARPGYKLATYDMSAIEPRLLAYYTGDLNLFDILHQGKDFHNYNTGIFFDLDSEEHGFKEKYKIEREVGKEVALALMYGAGVNRLMESAQKRGFVWTLREAKYKLDRFKEFYSGVYEFREEKLHPTLASGKTVVNLLGRPIRISDPDDVHMKGLNTLIQSSASDLVLNSSHRMMREFVARKIEAHVLLLVHDEIVTEVPSLSSGECEEIIIKAMTDYKLPTPLGPIVLKVEGKTADAWEK